MENCNSYKKIGVLGVRGLPATYGAFEQTISKLVEFNDKFKFYISTENSKRKEKYLNTRVERVFSVRAPGLGVIVYGLSCFIKQYLKGVRVYLNFGYGLSPFFPFMKLMGAKIICNVDGFEWRRHKWGSFAKKYFRTCEFAAARFADELIFDSQVIQRYYSIKYSRSGKLIYYGADNQKINKKNIGFENYFLMVMRLEPENSVLEIVRAFNSSNSTNSLLIIGPTTNFFEANVMSLVEKDPRIKYLGPIYNRITLGEFRSNCSGYIHGHTVGGVNPTLVEACDYESPIIAIDTRFNREVLGNHALYFNNVFDLKTIFDRFELIEKPSVPKLGAEFKWEYISEKYFTILENM